MKQNIYKTLIGVCLLLGLTACEDFLSHMPDDRATIESPDAVKELLVSAYPNGSYIAFCEAMSDNAEDKGPNARINSMQNRRSFYWMDQTSSSQDSYTGYWVDAYKSIAAANHALQAIEEEGGGKEYASHRGEAYICRAYNHFMLVNIFGEHYDPTTNEKNLGVPFVTKPENKVFVHYERESVGKTYELIEKDLLAGLENLDDRLFDIPTFHFNSDAANAFASRFYLYKGEWEKVLEYTNKVLVGDYESRIRKWNSDYRDMNYKTLQQNYTHSQESANLLLAGSISQWGRYLPYYRYGLGQKVLEKLFLSDNAFTGGWAYLIAGKPESYHIPKFKEHFRYLGINAKTGYPNIMAPLFVIEEVLFNRIEANIMLNRFDEALADLNLFLAHRAMMKDEETGKNIYKAEEQTLTKEAIVDFYTDFEPELTPFYTVTAEQRPFLNCVVDFSRREFILEGMRWFDVKRFHIEVERFKHSNQNPFKPNDILEKNDLRRAVQIPEDAQTYGIKPNPRN